MPDSPGIPKGLDAFQAAIRGIERSTPQFRKLSFQLQAYWNLYLVEAWTWQNEKPCSNPRQGVFDLHEEVSTEETRSSDFFQLLKSNMETLYSRAIECWEQYRNVVEKYGKLISDRYRKFEVQLPEGDVIEGTPPKMGQMELDSILLSPTIPPGFNPEWPHGDYLLPVLFFASLRFTSDEPDELAQERVLEVAGLLEKGAPFKEIKGVVDDCTQSIEDYLNAVKEFALEPMKYGWFHSADLFAQYENLRPLAHEWRDVAGAIANRARGRHDRNQQPDDPIQKVRLEVAWEAISEGLDSVPLVSDFLVSKPATMFGSADTARKWISGQQEILSQLGPAKRGRPVGSRRKTDSR